MHNRLLHISQNVFSQNKYLDSLENKTFKELKDSFFKTEENHEVSRVYASIYLNRAKLEKDTFRVAQGYKYLSYISSDSLALKYVDSIVIATKGFKNKIYPAFGYFLKGSWLYQLGNEKEAVNNFVMANEFAIKNKNTQIQLDVKQAIGAIKNDWGEYKEAQTIFEDYYNLIKQQSNYGETYKEDYVILLHNLTACYTRNGSYNKALKIINEGVEYSRQNNDSIWENQFIFDLGVVNYYQGNYNKALLNLEKSSKTLENTSLAINYFYRAKIFDKKKDKSQAIANYWRVDSLYGITNENFIELKEVYTTLLDYSKDSKQYEVQYEIIDKLLKVDSVIDYNEYNLNKNILKKYDIPQLKKERNSLKNKIETETRSNTNLIYLLIGFLILFVGFVVYHFNKLRKDKARFDIIMSQLNGEDQKPNILINDNSTLNISDKVVEDILIKIDEFEKTKGFIENGLTLNKISKKLNTNSTYLSKIINYHKDESFSNYINNLRVDYVVNLLNEDEKYRNYTIEALGKDIGFNNAESFSKAFHKKFKIYPSYFIMKLIKKERIS